MGGFKRTLTVSYAFVQAVCDLTSTKASEKDEDLVQLCANGHDPVKPLWDPYCHLCQANVGRGTLVKGREVAKGEYVVFTAEEIAALKSDDEQFKGKLALQAFPVEQVEATTIPSGTTYHLAPSPRDQFFPVLREMILDTPQLAYVGQYTVTSRAAVYRVRPYRDILVAEQYLRPEELVEAPTVTLPPVPDNLLEMAKELAVKFATDFDPATFNSTYRARLAEAVADREATGAGVGAPLPAAAPGADPMAALAAQMQAALSAAPAAAPAAPKRTRAKASRAS